MDDTKDGTRLMDREELETLRERCGYVIGMPYGYAGFVAEGCLALLDELAARDATIAELHSMLSSILRTFHEKGHPGRACIRSSWVPEPKVNEWRAALSVLDSEETQ